MPPAAFYDSIKFWEIALYISSNRYYTSIIEAPKLSFGLSQTGMLLLNARREQARTIKVWGVALCTSHQTAYKAITIQLLKRRRIWSKCPKSGFSTHPDPRLGQACPHRYFLSHGHIRVSVAGEHCFQLLKLVRREMGPLSALLSLLLEFIAVLRCVLCGEGQIRSAVLQQLQHSLAAVSLKPCRGLGRLSESSNEMGDRCRSVTL